ncbi:MAG TPA: tyrosine-type recombinase/integrase [Chondromyces sp.]|nr:tyrosine-type recombinase/integrase [Chondromyces sp.]
MKTVEAIKDPHMLQAMKTFLKPRSPRDYCLFLLGINTGIRIHDLLCVHVKEVMSEQGEIFPYLRSSIKYDPPVFLNKQVRESINNWIEEGKLQMDDFLFKSRKTKEPITRQQAYRIINEAAKQSGVKGAIGTHTLRKTFGYHAYRKGIAISLIQKRLQHGNPSETLQYLGLSGHESVPIVLDVNL